jgi:hypothetical protein
MDSSWWPLASINAQKYNLIAEVIVQCYNNSWAGGGGFWWLHNAIWLIVAVCWLSEGGHDHSKMYIIALNTWNCVFSFLILS